MIHASAIRAKSTVRNTCMRKFGVQRKHDMLSHREKEHFHRRRRARGTCAGARLAKARLENYVCCRPIIAHVSRSGACDRWRHGLRNNYKRCLRCRRHFDCDTGQRHRECCAQNCCYGESGPLALADARQICFSLQRSFVQRRIGVIGPRRGFSCLDASHADVWHTRKSET